MTTTLSLTVTEDGLHLPRQLFPRLGEVEVIDREDYLLIKPKSPNAPGADLRTRALKVLRDAGLVIRLTWPPPSAVSAAERAELARKLSTGRPLSEAIIEDRADRV